MVRYQWLVTFFFCIVLSANNESTEQPVVTLKPGETATVVKRTVVTIKTTTESGSPIPPSSSWRCKNIPDEAFSQLGTYSKGGSARHSWENRAAEFIATYAGNCPNFGALERELPPGLNQKKYLTFLSTLYDLNSQRPEGLLRIAREDELEKYPTRPKKKVEEYNRLLARTAAAKVLLETKFGEEMKGKYEAHQFVQKFGSDFLDKTGNPKTENFGNLKSLLKSLAPPQKVALKGYLKDVLARREYPKSGLLEIKQDRAPASLSKKEAGNRSVLQLLLFELD